MEYGINKNRYLLSLLFLSTTIIAYLVKILGYQDISSIFFFAMLFFLIIYLIDIHFLLKCLMILNFILSVVFAYYMHRNNIINFPDTIGYFNVLHKMIGSNSNNLKNVINYAGTLQVGYHYLNYFVFKVFDSKFALYLVNIVMSCISIFFFYYHLKKRYKLRVAIITTALLTISMYLLIFTSHILKDSLVLFLAMTSLHIYDKYIDERKIKQIFVLIIFLCLLIMTRIYTGVGFALGILVDFFVLNNKRLNKVKFLISTVMITGLVLISPINAHINMGWRFVNRIDFSNQFIINIIKSVITLFLSPFFWNMTKEFTIYMPIVLESIFFLIFSPLLLISLYKFIIYKNYRRIMYLYFIPIAVHILALGIQYGKVPVRQKIAIYPFVVFLYVFELYQIQTALKYNNKS